ncbi:tight adherence pilus pseudopilin TadF [Orbus wheelerorum]|uniref:tight adherence pilus pseudopilin TadF n=1 Tax=Orbus wheelerorum TaxID=3074111 RepID=UPI00370D5B2A
MMTNLIKFINNKKGELSIEFAAVVLLFLVLIYIAYDTYSSIMLQSKLDRTTYTVASLFRERTNLYPIADEELGSSLSSEFSLCRQSTSSACFKTYELFDQNQVNQMQKLATNLMNKDVSINIDSLFILQNPLSPGIIQDAKFVTTSGFSCAGGTCSSEIKNYFNTLPKMTASSGGSYSAFVEMSPFASRVSTQKNIKGRWVPIYRVNVCINNDESLYLKLFNKTRLDSDFLPNLCSEAVVISRCNSINDATKDCPIYLS